MPLYSASIFIPPIIPPRIDVDCPDPSSYKDERIKIAEVEAAFEKFENELSVQLCHNITPIGKRIATFPSGSEDFGLPGTCHIPRSATARGTLNSPFYINESLNLDNDMNELDFSASIPLNSRNSGSRLPRRVVAPRSASSFTSVPFNSFTLSTSVRRQDVYPNLSSASGEMLSSYSAALASISSAEPQVAVGPTETESCDALLEPDEESDGAALICEPAESDIAG